MSRIPTPIPQVWLDKGLYKPKKDYTPPPYFHCDAEFWRFLLHLKEKYGINKPYEKYIECKLKKA